MQTRLFSIPRLFSIIAIAGMGISASIAGDVRSETTTYVDGNLPGVSPNTGGTLVFSDDNAMYFRTGLSTVPVPYANISHAELGATRETSHDVPLYKVWALHKRFSGKTETQLLIVNFKNEAGEDKSMTLELAKASAPNVLAAIQTGTEKDLASGKTAVASAEQSSTSEPVKAATDETPRKESKKDLKRQAKLEEDMARDAAKTAAAKSEKQANSWWGDDYWKTTRNADKWTARTPMSPANNEQR